MSEPLIRTSLEADRMSSMVEYPTTDKLPVMKASFDTVKCVFQHYTCLDRNAVAKVGIVRNRKSALELRLAIPRQLIYSNH
jgi:hypothetical protein